MLGNYIRHFVPELRGLKGKGTQFCPPVVWRQFLTPRYLSALQSVRTPGQHYF